MKHILPLILMLLVAYVAQAQQPQIDVNTKVTYSSASNPQAAKNDKVHVTPDDLVLKPGQDNLLHFSVDGVSASQIIVKVVTESLCQGRKGQNLGDYILTPKANEGEVVVRIGAMDFMGAFQRHGEITFYIGSKPEPQAAAEPAAINPTSDPAIEAEPIAPRRVVITEEIEEYIPAE